MKKERTEAQKLGWYKTQLRQIWHRSPMYWSAYRRAKCGTGLIACESCTAVTNSKLMEMDHIEPVSAPGQDPSDIALWAARLNCPASGLRALCEVCHHKKTGKENSRRTKKGGAN